MKKYDEEDDDISNNFKKLHIHQKKRIDKLTKKLNKLSKAAGECAEAFKNFKQYLPIEIEAEGVDGGKAEQN